MLAIIVRIVRSQRRVGNLVFYAQSEAVRIVPSQRQDSTVTEAVRIVLVGLYGHRGS